MRWSRKSAFRVSLLCAPFTPRYCCAAHGLAGLVPSSFLSLPPLSSLPSSFTISPRGSPMPKTSAPQAFSSTHIIQRVENRNERTRDFLKFMADPDPISNRHGSSLVPNSESSPGHPHIHPPALHQPNNPPQSSKSLHRTKPTKPTGQRPSENTLTHTDASIIIYTYYSARPTNTGRHLPSR
jgi:hypothetical protein